MSPRRTVLSLLLVWYLAALTVAAVPALAAIPTVRRVDHEPYSSLAARVSPLLDSMALVVAGGLRRLSGDVNRLRPVTANVLAVAGLSQRWDMFASPQRHANYVRVTWFVAQQGDPRPGAPTWKATQLVLPMHGEDRVRALESFRDHSIDRAISTALEFHHPSGDPADEASLTDFSATLRPAVKYFTQQFEREHLQPGEHIVRVEAWHGAAEIAPPGASPEVRRQRIERLEWLRSNYGEIIEEPIIGAPNPAYYAVQREGDIVWTLEYIDKR